MKNNIEIEILGCKSKICNIRDSICNLKEKLQRIEAEVEKLESSLEKEEDRIYSIGLKPLKSGETPEERDRNLKRDMYNQRLQKEKDELITKDGFKTKQGNLDRYREKAKEMHFFD